MKKALIALLLLSAIFAGAADLTCNFAPDSEDPVAQESFDSAMGLVAAAVMLSVVIVTLSYMFGKATSNAELLVFSKDELFHLMVTVVLVISIIGFFEGSCFFFGNFLGSQGALKISEDYSSSLQVQGKVLDSRADLFSLGVLSYEMLANRKPFGGGDVVSIAHAIAHAKPVPISEANPELPEALDPVLERILAKEPSDRFATGTEFHEALRSCLLAEATDRSSKPDSVAAKRPPAFWGIAAVAVLAAAFMLFLWKGGNGAPRVDPPTPEATGSTIAKAAPATVPATKPPPRVPAKKAPAKASAPPAVPASGGALEANKAEPKPSAPTAPAVAPAPTVDVTISFAHRLRRGTLVVLLDGVAIFNENFSKAKLAVVQTTIWDPLKAPAGGHTLTARVNGEDGKTYVSDSYKFEFPPERGIELRIGLKGDTLTVKQMAG